MERWPRCLAPLPLVLGQESLLGLLQHILPYSLGFPFSRAISAMVLPDTSSVLQTSVPVWRGCDRGVGLRGK